LIQGHVLVVDDERCIVDVIADVFESEGFSVDRAQNGLEAMKAISRRRPDLVIADVLMPAMDGVSLARKIQERKSPIPVVLMSASEREAIRFDGPFIAKPFDIDAMLALAIEQIDDAKTENTTGIAAAD